MKHVLACIACILLSISYACAQTDKPTTLKGQANLLKTFFDQHEIEKAYLHFDKPYYAAGDTIYFKAYVVAGEKNVLSPLSGVLYADLITPQNKIINAIKLQIIDGLAWGDFALPDSLPAGNYRVRAYTRLMQNYGSELFFDRTVQIAAIIEKPVTKASAAMQATAPEIQFFPEGGELVPGVPAKVAFKALRADGTGIAASGIISNRAGKAIASFTTSHLGMGAVKFTPYPGESYHADVTFSDGSKNSIPLPAADSTAVAMAVNNLPGKLAIVINAGDSFFRANKNKPLSLLFYSGGKLTTFTDKLTNREMKFDLQSNRLQSGVTQITLLAGDGVPLCERLVFIDNNDKLIVDALTNKYIYQKREHVTLKIHVQNQNREPVSGHFSVSVVDKSKVDINEDKEENILTYLLLTSCLKGYIENPGYYFNNTNDVRRKNLDLVMLTHGYRRFTWKALANNDVPPPTSQPEKSLSIAGLAKSFGGKPINNGLVTLIPSAGGALLSENTDTTGTFRFNNLVFYDSTRFVLNAVNAKGSNNTQLIYRPQLPAPVDEVKYFASTDTSASGLIQAYLLNSKNQHEQFLKYYGKGIQLKEVKIQSVKKFAYRTQSLAGAGNADVLIKGSDLPRSGMLATLLSGRIGGVYFAGIDHPDGGVPKMQIGNGSPMLVIVDGVQRTGEPGRPAGINDIWPGDIETIEVLKYTSAAAYGMGGGNGVMVITTKRGVGRDPKDIPSRGVLPITLSGFYKAREFYAPKYDRINDRTRPDLRSTIHWLPEITTDKDGNASFDFYNADSVGQYQVIIEGITNDGTAGAAKFAYEVKE